MPVVTDASAYWDRYAAKAPEKPGAEALKTLQWTQHPDHGPGDELLGEPETALEMGCGRGEAVAFLATKGVETTGVDLSPLHIQQAQRRWGHLAGAHFAQADVIAYLRNAGPQTWDAVFSAWGALWFTDPEDLLPLVRERLTSGGRLVFSHAPPVPGSYGPQGMYGAGFSGPRVWLYQWAYEPERWVAILRRHGFNSPRAWVEAAPSPGHVGTLICVARP